MIVQNGKYSQFHDLEKVEDFFLIAQKSQDRTMKLYVFETDKWLESDVIYPHDIAICLVPEESRIYLWEGPRATPTLKNQAHETLDGVVSQVSPIHDHTHRWKHSTNPSQNVLTNM